MNRSPAPFSLSSSRSGPRPRAQVAQLLQTPARVPSESRHLPSQSKAIAIRALCTVAPATAFLWTAAAKGIPAPSDVLPPPEATFADADVQPASPPPPAEPLPPEPSPDDQGPDTLPALEEPADPTAPRAPSVPPQASRPAPERRLQPVRAERRLALLGELGWNGLAGFGPNLTFHAHPHVSFDFGAGLAFVGGKLGLRARYNLLDSVVTPFVGVGGLVASGFDSPTRDPGTDGDNPELNVKVLPSAFLQAVVGIDWTSRSGFTLIGALGYAWLLSRDNVEIVTGEPNKDERRALDIAFGSSAVVSLAIGYSFR